MTAPSMTFINTNTMSPNAYIKWNDDSSLLEGFQGEELAESPVFTWTYSVFEEYLNEAVTPSMYNFMAGYVHNNITKTHLYEIQGDDYTIGSLEADAVDAYFDLPINERIEMHQQELVNIECELNRARGKEDAFIDACIDDNCPFDVSSPIYVEYCTWCRKQKAKWSKIASTLESQLTEEEQWRGGHEDGASDCDPMEA